MVDGRDNAWRSRALGPHARGNTARCYGRPVDRGAWTAKKFKRPPQQPAQPQYAKYWAPLMRKRHTMPHPAQPRHADHWAPRTRKRHQQEHRPQRPSERSDLTQHAKGRTSDCPGPVKKQQPNGMSHRGRGGAHGTFTCWGGERWRTVNLPPGRPLPLPHPRVRFRLRRPEPGPRDVFLVHRHSGGVDVHRRVLRYRVPRNPEGHVRQERAMDLHRAVHVGYACLFSPLLTSLPITEHILALFISARRPKDALKGEGGRYPPPPPPPRRPAHARLLSL